MGARAGETPRGQLLAHHGEGRYLRVRAAWRSAPALGTHRQDTVNRGDWGKLSVANRPALGPLLGGEGAALRLLHVGGAWAKVRAQAKARRVADPRVGVVLRDLPEDLLHPGIVADVLGEPADGAAAGLPVLVGLGDPGQDGEDVEVERLGLGALALKGAEGGAADVGDRIVEREVEELGYAPVVGVVAHEAGRAAPHVRVGVRQPGDRRGDAGGTDRGQRPLGGDAHTEGARA